MALQAQVLATLLCVCLCVFVVGSPHSEDEWVVVNADGEGRTGMDEGEHGWPTRSRPPIHWGQEERTVSKKKIPLLTPGDVSDWPKQPSSDGIRRQCMVPTAAPLDLSRYPLANFTVGKPWETNLAWGDGDDALEVLPFAIASERTKRAQEAEAEDEGESITLVLSCSVNDALSHLLNVALLWSGPISMSLFTAPHDLLAQQQLVTMLESHPVLFNNVDVHFVHSSASSFLFRKVMGSSSAETSCSGRMIGATFALTEWVLLGDVRMLPSASHAEFVDEWRAMQEVQSFKETLREREMFREESSEPAEPVPDVSAFIPEMNVELSEEMKKEIQLAAEDIQRRREELAKASHLPKQWNPLARVKAEPAPSCSGLRAYVVPRLAVRSAATLTDIFPNGLDVHEKHEMHAVEKAALVQLMKDGAVIPHISGSPTKEYPLDFPRWMQAEKPYAVQYEEMYAPTLIVQRSGLFPSTGDCLGRELHAQRLYYGGYEFVVSPSWFAVQPAGDSPGSCGLQMSQAFFEQKDKLHANFLSGEVDGHGTWTMERARHARHEAEEMKEAFARFLHLVE